MITIEHIGKSADDLRFFILSDGRHAGGITVHSIEEHAFSYGVAIAPAMRRKGTAKAALPLLFERMAARGFSLVQVQIALENTASLALHRSLGFHETARSDHTVTMTRAI